MSTPTAEAPHGYGPDGKPLAPYGFKQDGTPRKDARGRQPGHKVAAGPRRRPAAKKAPTKRSDADTRDMLVGLADMVVMPLVGASRSPIVAKRIGERQALALAGDAVIVQNYAPHLADGVMALAQSKPGILAFLDQVEDKAPYLMLAQVGLQMAKAIVGNHVAPDERLAKAGHTMARIRAVQMAEAIEAQARFLGIPTDEEMVAEMPTGEAAAA